MPDAPLAAHRMLVINTTPIIALAVATGSLDILRICYDRVIVPHEVQQEILAGGSQAPAVAAFTTDNWLERLTRPQNVPPFLKNSLDSGEAAVIHAALDLGLGLVCIDEKMGRRVARLHGLAVTGSVGILVKAKQHGFPLNTKEALNRLHRHGIWLGKDVESFLSSAGHELPL